MSLGSVLSGFKRMLVGSSAFMDVEPQDVIFSLRKSVSVLNRLEALFDVDLSKGLMIKGVIMQLRKVKKEKKQVSSRPV